MKLDSLSKNRKLALGILFDLIGLVTVFDIIWAPASAFIMSKMYKGNKGKIAGVFSFIEEAIPGLDIIPTFTIMWFLTHVFQKENNSGTIELDSN